jgi:hypothetical protein
MVMSKHIEEVFSAVAILTVAAHADETAAGNSFLNTIFVVAEIFPVSAFDPGAVAVGPYAFVAGRDGVPFALKQTFN